MSSAPDSIPASPVVRPSACPGLVRVVTAADGGLCRIKLPGGRLDAHQARAIAAAARACGSGAIDATNRANLQLRGIRADAADALIRALLDAGLGPSVDATADAVADTAALAASDDVRNVMLSPLAGDDPAALVDSRALAAPLLDMLAREPRRGELSPKFSIQLDGGESVAALDHPHDIWLAAWRRGDGAVRIAAGLAGCPPIAHDARPASVDVAPDQGVALVRALLLAFLDLAPADVTRMRALLATCGERALLERAQHYVPFPLAADPALAGWRRARTDPALRFGVHPSRDTARCHVGAQFPLGRLDATQLERLAALAETDGDGTLSMTPWQGVFMHRVPRERAPATLDALASLGLVCASSDPLASLVACTGSAGCAKARADTKHDALALAARIGHAVDVHLTGCERHCALPHPATHTLVAVAPAHYDLYRCDAAGGLGAPLARHLTIDQAAARLTGARHNQDTTMLDYIRDGQEIYRQSFATIRAEADLSQVPPDLEKLAVRVIHACGMVDVVCDLRFSAGAGTAGRTALAAGAPILCDARMVAEGITRARLPAGNRVICTLGEPEVPDLARDLGNTRSAAALELWRPQLAGSVVVIGNAPTALFHLLDMIDAGAPRPALILGFPVGFIGAAESKALLDADSRGVPYVTLLGRRGGSAMAAAAVNALATEVE